MGAHPNTSPEELSRQPRCFVRIRHIAGGVVSPAPVFCSDSPSQLIVSGAVMVTVNSSMNYVAAYETLDLEPGADTYHVRRAYKRLSRLHHPDGGGDAASFRRIAEAHEFLLKDPTAGSVSADCECVTMLRGGVVREMTLTKQGLCVVDEDKCVLKCGSEQRIILPKAWSPSRHVASFLCCCLVGGNQARMAVGDSDGTIRVVSLSTEAKDPDTTLDVEAAVLALASPEHESSLLIACIPNKVLLLSVESGMACHILFNPGLGFQAETACFVRGSAVIGGSGGCADGLLVCLRVEDISKDSCLFDAEDEVEPPLVWTADHDHVIFAIAAVCHVPEAPKFAAAAGSVVALHDINTGCTLMRMVAA